jgi:hypothetical protein
MRWWEYYYEALGTMNITKFAANVKVLCTVKGGSRSSTAMKHIQNEFTLQNGRKDVNPDCILCETEKQTTDIVRRGSIIAIQGKMKKKMMMMMRAYSWLFRSCKRIFFFFFFFTNSKAKSKASQVSPSASPSPPYGDEGHGFG